MIKLIGVERKTGEFNGKSYDNIIFHLVEPVVSDNDGFNIGERAVLISSFGKLKPLSVKSIDVYKKTGVSDIADLSKFIGNEVFLHCDYRGNIDSIELVGEV